MPDWVPVVGGDGWDGWSPSVDYVPYLAEGGIVTKPTLAMIGEAGPEAVIPLSRGNARGLRESIEVHIHGDVNARDSAEAQTAVGDIVFGVVNTLRAKGLA